jgi:ABC-type multidrug transport system fused ATPase/permease subunit
MPQGCDTIVRRATIRSADVIFVLQNGEIVESGQHDELLSRRGLYAGLHDLQFQP